MSVTTHARTEVLNAGDIARGHSINAKTSAIDLLRLEPFILSTDLKRRDDGRYELVTESGLQDPPVGILVRDEEKFQKGEENPWLYINLINRLATIDPDKPLPSFVQDWQTYVEANSKAVDSKYNNPLATLLEKRIDDQAALTQLGETALTDINKPEGYRGTRRVESRWSKLKGKLSDLLVQPAETSQSLLVSTDLVGPVERTINPELVNTPIATILNELGDPTIMNRDHFISAARRDPEWARQALTKIHRNLYGPIGKRADSGDPEAIAAAQEINNAFSLLRQEAGLVNKGNPQNRG